MSPNPALTTVLLSLLSTKALRSPARGNLTGDELFFHVKLLAKVVNKGWDTGQHEFPPSPLLLGSKCHRNDPGELEFSLLLISAFVVYRKLRQQFFSGWIPLNPFFYLNVFRNKLKVSLNNDIDNIKDKKGHIYMYSLKVLSFTILALHSMTRILQSTRFRVLPEGTNKQQTNRQTNNL